METDDLDPDPLAQFRTWLDEADASGMYEPHAMVLATADEAGRPNARFVLLRGLDGRGFEFYTNYASPKARALDANPRAALVFGWGPMHRQVRITGDVERVSPEESDAYWATRPRGAQIGAWASPQSQELTSRVALEASVAEHEARFAGADVPRPAHWGGFRVVPDEIEFWQGQPNRLHDRVRYTRDAHGWTRGRLAP